MTRRSLRGQVAVAGVGETTYYRHGQAAEPEFVLCLKAILAACQDAGIDPRDIDGFASYSNDRNDPPGLATALGTHELSFSCMQWGGGGGGGAGRWRTPPRRSRRGLADCVVVYRALAQGQFGRFGQGARVNTVSGDMALSIPYGQMSPAQWYAPQGHRASCTSTDRAGSAASDRHGVIPPCPGKPAGGDARPAAHRAGV